MRLVALAQKFDVVSESHQFLYEFLVLSRDMVHNACRQTYGLDSICKERILASRFNKRLQIHSSLKLQSVAFVLRRVMS